MKNLGSASYATLSNDRRGERVNAVEPDAAWLLQRNVVQGAWSRLATDDIGNLTLLPCQSGGACVAFLEKAVSLSDNVSRDGDADVWLCAMDGAGA